MAKPEWGTKRACQSCGTKFYDFSRDPSGCPKCGARFDPETLLKSRRPRAVPAVKAAKPVAKVAVAAKAAEVEGEALAEDVDLDLAETDDDLEDIAEDDEAEESLIEDASELDDEGVAEVVVTKDDEVE